MNFPFLDPIEINRVRDAVNADAEFRLASRFFSKDILLVAGDSKCIVKVREGVVTEIELNPTFMNPWSFFIKGGADAWEKFLRPIPPPLFTDLYGCISRQHFELGGDIEAAFAHFWAVTRMLEVFRALQNDSGSGEPRRSRYANPGFGWDLSRGSFIPHIGHTGELDTGKSRGGGGSP